MNRQAIRIGTLAGVLASFAGAASQEINVLSDVEDAQGFQSLFDGSLASFNTHFVNYKQGDSTNVVLSPDWKADPSIGAITTDGLENSHIRSTEKYADFDFRFDYRNDGDGGVLYRFTVKEYAPYQSGVEYSIIDDNDNCKTCAGAAVDLYPPIPLVYHRYATEEWNHARLVVIKDSVEHWLNGVKVAGYKYHSADFFARFDVSKWATTPLTLKVPGNRWGGYIESGYLGFQSLVNSHWQLRNLRINKLSPKLGDDKFWTPIAAATGISAPRSAAMRNSSGENFLRRGTFIYRPEGGIAVSANGRKALR